MLDISLNIDNYKDGNKTNINLIESYINAFKSGIIFVWEQKIAPVNLVWLLNQLLLNQKKLTL